MSQVGWYIWRRRRIFPSLRAMVEFALATVERSERCGPRGCITLVGYDVLPGGVHRLRSITDWQASVIHQVESDAEHLEPLTELLARAERRG